MNTRNMNIHLTSSPRQWRIAIVEDHLLQRRRTEELIRAEPGLSVVHSCETMPDFLHWLATVPTEQRPHLLMLDLMVDRAPSASPVSVKKLIEAGLKVVVLSAMASPSLVRDVIQAGVGAIVGKRDAEEDIIMAVRAVLDSGHWMSQELADVIAADPQRPQLSGQEERALVLYASGLTLDAVADAIGVKPDTAKQYLERVKSKYASIGRKARTKLDLNRIALTDGYLAEKPSGPQTAVLDANPSQRL